MRRNYLYMSSIVLLTISLSVLAYVSGKQSTPKPNSSTPYRLSGPYVHKNLTVFLVHGSDSVTGHNFLTLQEALAQKKVMVFETKSVNELAIQNLSTQDVYVQAGDIVRGGEQDRMISVDFIVPPKSGRMPIAAFCVESQRWNRRGNEEARNFSSSSNSVSTKSLKLAAKRSNSQQEVWTNVTDTQAKLSKNVGGSVQEVVSRSSLELSVENDKVKETTAPYINALAGILADKTDVIGYAFAINGQVNSADVYASGQLFAKLWPKLLKANAVEAVAELEKDAKAEAVTGEMIEEFLVASERGKVAEKEVTQRVRLLTREDEQNIFFETRDRANKDAWIHRNYIRK